MPKVSVILTSYNHAKYLRDCIESVLNQTYSDFELLIGDDASTDESWDIIQSYTDPRIHAYRHETNRMGGIINELVLSGRVSSDYIAIHSSDDIWEPQKLERQVAFLDARFDIGAVFTNVLLIGENSELLLDEVRAIQKTVFDQPNRSRYEWLNYFFCIGNALCHPSVLIRRACYVDCGIYRYGLLQLGDFDLWVRLCLKYEIHVLPEKLFRLRVRSNEMNASADRPDSRVRRQFEILKILDNFKNVLTFEELVKIFPSAEKYIRSDGFDAGFVLGMISLETETFYGNITHLFGLILLFEALNDPDRSNKIAKLYDFTQKDFAELSARYDVFSVKLLANLTLRIAEKEEEISMLVKEQEQKILTLAEEKNNLTQLLLEIQGSRAWKLVTTYRKIQAGLISTIKYRVK